MVSLAILESEQAINITKMIRGLIDPDVHSLLDRQTGRQADRQADGQADMQTSQQADRHAVRQVDKQTD